MRTKLIRILSICMTIVMLFTIIPLGTITVSASGVTLAYLQSKYPHGKYWNGGNAGTYTSTPCTHHGNCSFSGGCWCNNFKGHAIQCMGFAYQLASLIYGGDPWAEWTANRNSSALNSLKAGDVVRYKNDGHSIFVTAVNGDTVTYADCNSDNHYIIRWNQTISKTTLKSTFTYVDPAPYAWDGGTISCNCSTSYAGNYTCTTSSISLTIRNGHGTSFSAIGSIPSGATVYVSKADGKWAHVTYNGISGYASMEYLKIPHSHSYTTYFEAAHPHRVYKKCSCGDWAYTGATQAISTCSSCWSNASVSFNKSSVSLVIPTAQTTTLNIQLSAAETWPSGAGYSFDYDSNIISVSQNGTVLTITAKKAGSTNFTMKIVDKNNNNALIKTAVCPITVKNATYSVKYTANGGSGAPSNQIKEYGSPLTLSTTIPKRPGYTFMGWATGSSTTTASYLPGGSYSGNSNITLYAVWKSANQLSRNSSFSAPISFGNQEYYFKYTPSQSGKYVIYSEASKDTKVYLYNSSGTLLTSNDDGGEGSNFRLAYNLTAGATYYYGIKFYSSSQIGSIPFKFGNVYTVTYNANGGTGAPNDQTYDCGKSVTLSEVIPERTGYMFLGWATSQSATTASFHAGETCLKSGSVTLYAVWERIVIKDIKIETFPTKLSYCKGQKLDTAGLVLKVTYTDGSTKKITSDFEIEGYDSLKIGVQSIYINYGEKQIKYTIEVFEHIYDNQCDSICNRCSATRLISHNFIAATCTAPKICIVCGMMSGKVIAHNYDSGKVTKAATCKATGVKTYTCSVCNGTKTETIAKLTTHTYSNNCDKSCNICGNTRTVGTHKYTNSCDTTCNICQAVRETEPHKYDDTCDESCNTCGAVRTVTHDYASATCKAPKTCKVCGATSGTKLSHKSDSGTVTKKATCTATGTKTYKCTLCKEVIKTDTIAKVSHKYDTGKVTKAATCKATGVKTYTCDLCKGTKTETIAKLTTHSYKTTTTKATLSKNGSIVKKCTVCGKVASNTAIKYAKTFKLSAASYTYDGKVKSPTVTVKDSAGKTLKKGVDYTVTYASGRKNVGAYKVTVKMIGKYSGTKTLTFKINPAKTTVSKLTPAKKSITVVITKKATQVTGCQIQYSTSKTFSKATTKTISSYKTTKYTLKSLSAKKTYYVRVRTYKKVGNTTYYSGWSTYKYTKTN